MIIHDNCLQADDSHEISCLICYFWKSGKICNCLLQIIGGLLRVNEKSTFRFSARCGYVLQPDCMRYEDYSPFDKKSIRVDPLTITITVSIQETRSRAPWLESHRRHCIVPLNNTTGIDKKKYFSVKL